MLTTVVFDADETLIDLRPAVTAGLEAVLAEMRRLTPVAASITLADLESDWHVMFKDLAAAPVVEIRRAALARSLDRAGLGPHLDEISAIFFARRFALTRPFADALPALATLRQQWTLGFATNGNSRAERCGLAGEFAFEVYAHRSGVPKKPAPDFYAAVCAAAEVEPAQVVHVGDNLVHDVLGAQRAGMRAVWLDRRGEVLPAGVVPDAVVSTLAELPSALAGLSGEADLPPGHLDGRAALSGLARSFGSSATPTRAAQPSSTRTATARPASTAATDTGSSTPTRR